MATVVPEKKILLLLLFFYYLFIYLFFIYFFFHCCWGIFLNHNFLRNGVLFAEHFVSHCLEDMFFFHHYTFVLIQLDCGYFSINIFPRKRVVVALSYYHYHLKYMTIID